MKVHIFIGRFKTYEEAILYTEPYWEPEPDDSASDEEYSKWEDNNPKWQMESDLDCYLDSDFIETIIENKYDYLCGLVKNSEEVKHLDNELNSKDTTLVLIFDKAINSQSTEFKSTDSIEYRGHYESTLE